MAPIDASWLFSVLIEDLPATLWLLTLHLYRSTCSIGYANNNLSTMAGNEYSASYLFSNWSINRLINYTEL